MSEYTVIADIGMSLLGVLRDNMAELLAPASIALLSPADIEGQDIRLTLFLYHVSDNPAMKNEAPLYVAPGIRRTAPLQVELLYLLTAHGSQLISDRTERSLEEHRLLGRAMRVMYDTPVLSGSLLKGGLAGSNSEFRLMWQALSLDEQTKIWTTLPNHALKTSIGYLVTPVAIDSLRTTEAPPVVERTLEYYQKGPGP